jgi:aminoglycoside phosphotransferase (APT) family kinase protein
LHPSCSVASVVAVRKHEITAEVVACLIRQQVPELAGQPVRAVDVDGWDNSSFRVGQTHLARLPTGEVYAQAVAKEHQWLPVLARLLPVAVPEPIRLGRPGCGFPRPWSLYRWLPGEPTSTGRVDDLRTFARDVAGFLTALHQVSPQGGPPAGDQSFGRGGPLQVYDADVHASLPHLPPDIDAEQVLTCWREAMSNPYLGEPCWFHGDMAPSNLLVRDGRLSAVIDFGTCGTGDPSCDLVLAWTYFDDTARRTFRQHLGLDGGTWRRGGAWALWKALATLTDDDPPASVRRYGWRYDAAEVIRRVLRAPDARSGPAG